MTSELKQEMEGDGGEGEKRQPEAATGESLVTLRDTLYREFTARVPATTDAAMHALHLDKALRAIKKDYDTKEDYPELRTWTLKDYRRFYKSMQKSSVYRTANPKHWWDWPKWLYNQSWGAKGELLKQAGLLALQKGLVFTAIGGAFSLGLWFLGRDQRRTQAIYQDWQVINTAQGKPGSGGRKQAIEDLYKQGESLTGLSAKGAYLDELNLAKHEKQQWNPFDHERVAILWSANLSDANIEDANLTGANLDDADLSGAHLEHDYLSDVGLRGANLRGAYLDGTDLSGTYLSEANLSAANLWSANLSNAILLHTDLSNTENLKPEQLKEKDTPAPLLCNVRLPKNITGIDSYRDCDRIPQTLVKLRPDEFPDLQAAQEYVNELRQKKFK